MRSMRLSGVAQAIHGHMGRTDACVSSVVVDSREAGPGSLFVALPGPRHDGHHFVRDARARGAVAAVVRIGFLDLEPFVQVEDPGGALMALAAAVRNDLAATVVGITGSSGKTTTKDLTAAVLATGYRVHASPASFNNEIGVPLTILGAPEETEVLVCEIGAGAAGEIATLCHVARPELGIVTNVGLAHVETFGSAEAIRRAKAELPQALPPEGFAILNDDDEVVHRYAGCTDASVVRFGVGTGADVRAFGVALRPDGSCRFRISAGRRTARVDLGIPGRHMVWNALAAAACGLVLGVPLDSCAQALGRVRASPGRLEVRTARGEVRVVHDAYNANPSSMVAALRTLRDMEAPRRIAVLGEMAELGELAGPEHERIGALFAELRIDILVAIGSRARRIALGALQAGMAEQGIHFVEGPVQAVEALQPMLRSGDAVLVKGSRLAGLERVVEALTDPPTRGAPRGAGS